MSAKTAFTNVSYDLAGLLNDLKMGSIALPDIQRPFVRSIPRCGIFLTTCIAVFQSATFYFGQMRMMIALVKLALKISNIKIRRGLLSIYNNIV